jgi:hypothetical protein
MTDIHDWHRSEPVEHTVLATSDLGRAANDLCEKSLNDAKAQLHPLLREANLNRLDQRREFIEAFKSALEERIARNLVLWEPGVQAVFRFDEAPVQNAVAWDGSIHLLLKVGQLSSAVQALGKRLDQSLTRYLKHMGWPRFQQRKSILEIQQVTQNEIRHGISYGAMFYAVHTVPVKVWPREKR